MKTLTIANLKVEVEGKEVLHGISLTIKQNEIVCLMGPNGSGKSTLANTIMGHPKYKVTEGSITITDENGTHDILTLSPDARSRLGLFLSFQYPAEISGVTIPNFLRTALAAQGKKMSVMEFRKFLSQKLDLLKMDQKYMTRYLNDGFSGGEKKRAEILQFAVLEPSFAMLDETDSGTDVDALKTISESIALVKKEQHTGILLITHYDRILRYLHPDKVIVMMDGKIIKVGTAELASEIEKTGYLAKELHETHPQN